MTRRSGLQGSTSPLTKQKRSSSQRFSAVSGVRISATFTAGWALSLFAMDFSILPIAACVMGGMGTLVGPVLGAFILTPMSEALRGFGQLRVVLYCLILIGFMVYKPEGIMNALQRKYHQFEVWEEV